MIFFHIFQVPLQIPYFMEWSQTIVYLEYIIDIPDLSFQ